MCEVLEKDWKEKFEDWDKKTKGETPYMTRGPFLFHAYYHMVAQNDVYVWNEKGNWLLQGIRLQHCQV